MKSLKEWLLLVVSWIIFTRLSTFLVLQIQGLEEEPLIYFANALFAAVSPVLYLLLSELKDWLILLFYILSWPFRLFRKNKTQDRGANTASQNNNLLQGDAKIVVVITLFYGIGGWLLGRFFTGEYWLMIYLFLGLCWGSLMYLFLRKGWLSKDVF